MRNTILKSPVGILVAFLIFLPVWKFAPRFYIEWTHNQNYGHVIFALPVALLILFSRLFLPAGPSENSGSNPLLSSEANGESSVSAWRYGVPLLVLGSVGLYLDSFLQDEMLLGISLWLGGLGIVALLWGRGRLRTSLFPFLLLLYAIPLPNLLSRNLLHIHLQRVSAACAGGILGLAGLDVNVSGTIIDIAGASLNVEEACSGLRFITVATFVSLLAGWLVIPNRCGRRLVLFLAGALIAFLANIVRLVVAGGLASWFGMDSATGFLHSWSVLVVYCFAISLLLLFASVLREGGEWKEGKPDAAENPGDTHDGVVQRWWLPRPRIWPVCLVAAWLIFAGSVSELASWSAPLPRGPDLQTIPGSLGEWTSQPGTFTDNIDLSPAVIQQRFDDAFTRFYRHPFSPVAVEVEIFYADSRRPRNRLTHLAMGCYYARYPRLEYGTVQLQSGHDAVRLRSRTGDKLFTLLYWYQSPGKTSAGNWPHLVHLYRQDLLRRRSDGCLVKLVHWGASNSASDRHMMELAREVHTAVTVWLAGKR